VTAQGGDLDLKVIMALAESDGSSRRTRTHLLGNGRHGELLAPLVGKTVPLVDEPAILASFELISEHVQRDRVLAILLGNVLGDRRRADLSHKSRS